MNPLFRSPTAFDEALGRALAQAEIPPVPSGLADRIVANVTALPQEEPASATPSTHKSRQPRLALAASIALVVVLSAGVLALWQADGRHERRNGSRQIAFAEDPPEVSRHIASRANAARDTNSNRASSNIATSNGNVRAPASNSEIERIVDELEPSAAPIAGAEPTPSTDAEDRLAHEGGPSMPADPSETKDPVGPSLAGRENGPVSKPDGVYGPPAPQGLGIAGGGSSQTPNSPPIGSDQGGTVPNRQGPKTSPTGSGPGGRAPGSRR